MAVTNPCCCSLRLGTQIIAIFNIVCYAIALVCYVSLFVPIGRANYILGAAAAIIVTYSDEDILDENARGILMTLGIPDFVFIIIRIITLLIFIAIGISLLNGAEKRDASKCRLWFNITTFFLVVYILYYAAAIIIFTVYVGPLAFMTQVLIPVIVVLFDLYQLCVVSAFIDEIERVGGRQNAARSSVV